MKKAGSPSIEAGRLTECPHCGSDDGIHFNDYGNVLSYNVSFGTGEQFLGEIYNSTKPPVWGFCNKCKKRVRIKDVRDKYVPS